MNNYSFPAGWAKISIKKWEQNLRNKPESYWTTRGQLRALGLFKKMAVEVPAYKHFLRKHKINPDKIKNINDFKEVPPTDKNNYLRQYSLKDVCWEDDTKTGQWIFSATSGTTGEPFYFPRSQAQDRQYALLAELYLRTNFQIHKRSTLYINGFAMGIWIGGLFTYQAIRHVAESGKYRLSIISPGLNKTQIIEAVKKLGPHFDQIIIGGYPPFTKDVIDEGILAGLNWKRYNLGFIFSAESFSEKFRDYIIKKTGLKNKYLGTLNHYGTVDQGTLAYETPISILIRRLALKNKNLMEPIFGQTNRLPTLGQYLPEMFYFEASKGQLFCSAFSGIPLARYDLKDRGGLIPFSQTKNIFKQAKVNLNETAKKYGIYKTLWNLPFVYVYERTDLALSWYGANIYPEHIKEAHQHPQINKHLTGKFSMELTYDQKHNPLLNIHCELQKNRKPTKKLLDKLSQLILYTLLEKNSEFKNNYLTLPHKNTPRIKLWGHETKPHFGGNGKQKWAIKNS